MKNPAVLWYPSDFIASTIFWDNEQCGAYIRLLNYQFTIGHMTMEDLKKITIDELVLSKFVKDKNGLFFNRRMEMEIIKRQKYSQSRAKNKLGKIKDVKNTSKSYDIHMGNENININNNNSNNIIDSNTNTNEELFDYDWVNHPDE